MAVIHISESDAARDFAGLLAQVRAGAEVIIEQGSLPVAVMHAPMQPRLTMKERIAMMPDDSPAIDNDFARDVTEAVKAHRESLHSSAWD